MGVEPYGIKELLGDIQAYGNELTTPAGGIVPTDKGIYGRTVSMHVPSDRILIGS